MGAMDSTAAQAESDRLLLVETHSPSETGGDEFLRLARTLLADGALVQLHLMQNAVIWLEQDRGAIGRLQREFGSRLRVSADDVSMDLRGLPRERAAGLAEPIGADRLVADMAQPGVKTLWHS